MSKTKQKIYRKKIASEFLHQRLGHRSTRSFLSRDAANVWEDIEIIIDPYPFYTSCQISSMNKKSRSKNPLNPKAPFKWVFVDIIPSTAPKQLTVDTNFSKYLFIVDAYSKIPKFYDMGEFSTEEVMDKLYMFQSRYVNIDEFGWWELEMVSSDAGLQFTSTEFKE